MQVVHAAQRVLGGLAPLATLWIGAQVHRTVVNSTFFHNLLAHLCAGGDKEAMGAGGEASRRRENVHV